MLKTKNCVCIQFACTAIYFLAIIAALRAPLFVVPPGG